MEKEMEDVLSAIQKWGNKHNGDVVFLCSFVDFKKNFDVKNDMTVAFGPKECIKTAIGFINEEMKKEKSDFIDWF